MTLDLRDFVSRLNNSEPPQLIQYNLQAFVIMEVRPLLALHRLANASFPDPSSSPLPNPSKSANRRAACEDA